MNSKYSKVRYIISFLIFTALFLNSCGSSFLAQSEIKFTGESGITIPGDIYPQDNIQLIASQPPDQSMLVFGFLTALMLITLSLMALVGKLTPG